MTDEEDEAAVLGGFRASSRGPTARFAAGQAAIIRDLVGQIADLVGGGTPDGPEARASDAAPGAQAGDAGPADAGLTSAQLAGEGLAGAEAMDEMAARLGLGDAVSPPDDPVLARLLPDAYQGDADAAADFRRYTEQGLRTAKVAAARTVLATLPAAGGKVRLSEPEAQAWLRALNDVRLALGVILGITQEPDESVLAEAEVADGDPAAAYLWVYQWLAVIQDSLVEALS